MGAVRHGRMDLAWCLGCGSPILRGRTCPSCGGKVTRVKYTPPGDVRPAFPYDVGEARDLADSQWGEGAGISLLPRDGPIVINPCPSTDRLDEVIQGGEVICSIIYSTRSLSRKLLLRIGGGRTLCRSGFSPRKGSVVADDGAVPHLLEGSNLLSPGILDADPKIGIDEEVLVLDTSGSIIGSGMAKKRGQDMVGTRGMGVKVRWISLPDDGGETDRPAGSWDEEWQRVVEINRPLLEEYVRRSQGRIGQVVEEVGLPVAVSFSGGKDSLATLLLAMDAGLQPPVMFVNTGIEFPETVDYVHRITEEMGVELIEGRPDSGFFENVERFGPPGRDFRWCCKSCKLGPTTGLIRDRYPDGVLAFIGQRRYESESRRSKGSLWRNPWVPSQVGFSPVQDWTALDIWLYIFMKGAKYNPLYRMGFNRIGCWLCPSSDLAEMELVLRTEVDTSNWSTFLEGERSRLGLPPEWITYGFHRFKRLPGHMVNLARELGLEGITGGRRRSGPSRLELVEGFRSCRTGFTTEGVVGSEVPWDRLVSLLNIMGRVEGIPDTDGVEIRPRGWDRERPAAELYPDGTLMLRGTSEEDIKDRADALRSAVIRAADCVGCGVCVGRCDTGALEIDPATRKAVIDPERCSHCGSCLGPCPAEAYADDPYL